MRYAVDAASDFLALAVGVLGDGPHGTVCIASPGRRPCSSGCHDGIACDARKAAPESRSVYTGTDLSGTPVFGGSSSLLNRGIGNILLFSYSYLLLSFTPTGVVKAAAFTCFSRS